MMLLELRERKPRMKRKREREREREREICATSIVYIYACKPSLSIGCMQAFGEKKKKKKREISETTKLSSRRGRRVGD